MIEERNRRQIQQAQLVTELRQISQCQGIEAAVQHFAVVVASEPHPDVIFQMAAFRALREFLSDPAEHGFLCLWADVDFEIPGGTE